MQQIAQLSNDVVIEFFRSGIPGITAMIGALGIFFGTMFNAFKHVTNGRKQDRIERHVDGRFSDMLKVIDKLSAHVEKETLARIESERRITKALATISARTGHPFTTIDDLLRAEDVGREPRRPSGTVPRRRKNSGE
jgi:hypothetical protein